MYVQDPHAASLASLTTACTALHQSAGLETLQADLKVPNHRIPISAEGVKQASLAGQHLRACLSCAPPLSNLASIAAIDPHPTGGGIGSLGSPAALEASRQAEAANASTMHQTKQEGNGNTPPTAAVGSTASMPGGAPHHVAGGGHDPLTSGDLDITRGRLSDVVAPCEEVPGVSGSGPGKLFIYTSPYLRCIQTAQHVLRAFTDDEVAGLQVSKVECCCGGCNCGVSVLLELHSGQVSSHVTGNTEPIHACLSVLLLGLMQNGTVSGCPSSCRKDSRHPHLMLLFCDF